MDRLTKPNGNYTSFKNHKLQQYENTELTPDEITDLRAQLAVTEKALELAVDSDASNFCVFNGIEKELWPDYCKDPPETEHKTCIMCWCDYYLSKAGDHIDHD